MAVFRMYPPFLYWCVLLTCCCRVVSGAVNLEIVEVQYNCLTEVPQILPGSNIKVSTSSTKAPLCLIGVLNLSLE